MAGPACQRTMPADPMACAAPAHSASGRCRLGTAAVASGLGPSRPQPVPAGRRDHGRVVGAHRRAGQEAAQAVALAGLERPASAGASWRRRRRRAPAPWRRPRRAAVVALCDEHVDDGLLEAGGHVGGGHVGVGLRTWLTTAVLSPLKLKSSPSWSIARGKAMARRVAVDGSSVDGRPARVAEAEEPGHLVEGLAGGVVDGLAEQAVAAVVDASRSASCGRRTRAARRRAARASGSSRKAA